MHALQEFTALDNGISFFISMFFPCHYFLCLQLLRHGSYLSFNQVLSFHTCTIMSPLLPNADCPFFKRLPSPSRSDTILAISPYFVIFSGFYVLNFWAPHHEIMASSSDSSCFGLYTDLNFCTEYSYMGHILNSNPESCVCWLLSLKCHACQMDSKRILFKV